MEGTETVGEDTSTVEAAERGDGEDTASGEAGARKVQKEIELQRWPAETTEQVIFMIINIGWESKAK